MNHQKVADELEQLMNAQIEKYQAGSLENRWVLETLDKWSEAKTLVIEDRVNYRRALLELELIRGATLRNRDLELTKSELREKSKGLLAQSQLSTRQMEDFLKRTEAELEKQLSPQ